MDDDDNNSDDNAYVEVVTSPTMVYDFDE